MKENVFEERKNGNLLQDVKIHISKFSFPLHQFLYSKYKDEILLDFSRYGIF